MDPERWARVRRVFRAALAAPASERGALLGREAAGDSAIAATLDGITCPGSGRPL